METTNPQNSTIPLSSGGSPEDTTRLDSSVINGKENKGPFVRQVGNRIEKVKYSFIKAIKCGDYIEFHEAEFPYLLGKRPRNSARTNSTVRNQEYRRRNAKRAMDSIRRLVLGNFNDEIKLLTLTFNNENDFDITDISVCNKKFSVFMHMLRKLYGDYKYVAVLELQKRKAVHYHIICDLPYIDKHKIAIMWELGFIDIRRTTVSYQALLYITKYLHKELKEERYRNKRVYFASKNLIRPKYLYNRSAYDLRGKMAYDNKKSTFTYTIKSKENGKIIVDEYNLNVARPRTITPNGTENK